MSREDDLRRSVRRSAKVVPLSREEEHELFTQFHNATDETTRRAIMTKIAHHNIGMIVKVAARYNHEGYGTFEDRMADAWSGLLEAIPRFNPKSNARFMTYAMWHMKKAIFHGMGRRLGIYFPQGAFNRRNKIMKSKLALEQDSPEEEVTTTMIATLNKLSVAFVEAATAVEPYTRSFEEKIDRKSSGESRRLIDTLADPANGSPLDAFARKEVGEKLRSAIREKLSPRERFVITRRFGLDGKEPENLRDIGKKLGMTREAIRQIEEKILRKLLKAIPHLRHATDAL